jgi:hypothetical protein
MAQVKQVLVQMGTAVVIGCSGDAVIQRMEASWSKDPRPQPLAAAAATATAGGAAAVAHAHAEHEHDWGRSGRMAAFRLPQAPLLAHVWGKFDAWALRLGLVGAPAVAFKVGCDQALLNPTVTTAFFTSQGLMEGCSLTEVGDRVAKGFWPTVTAAFQYWVFAHAITFGVVPVKYRVAWSSTAAVAWTAYLSHANQGLRVDAAAEAVAAEKALEKAAADAHMAGGTAGGTTKSHGAAG